MPYTQRSSFYPAPGHEAHLREILIGRVGALQQAGFRAILAQTFYGSAPAAFHAVLPFDDLGAVGKYMREQEEGIARLRSDIAPFIREPAANALTEVLVPNPNPSPAARYWVRIVQRLLPDKAAEATALMVEWARTRGSQGYRWALVREMAGPDSGSLVTSLFFEHLEEWEELRTRGSSEEAAQQYLRDLTPLMAAPGQAEVLQVLVPMQAGN